MCIMPSSLPAQHNVYALQHMCVHCGRCFGKGLPGTTGRTSKVDHLLLLGGAKAQTLRCATWLHTCTFASQTAEVL